MCNHTVENKQVTYCLDVRGKECPLPILKTKLIIAELNTGDIILVKCTDPHAELDFQVFCERCHHELLKITKKQDEIHFYVKIK